MLAESQPKQRLIGRRARRPISMSFGASLIIQATNALTGVLLARTLGPEGRGELTAVLLWPSLLAAVGTLGIYESTSFHAARGEDSPGTIVGTAIAIAAIQAVVLVSIGFAVVPVILAHYGPSVERSGLVFLAFVPLNLIALYLMAALNGLAHFGRFNVLRVLVVAVTAVSLGGLALAHTLSARNAVSAYLAANLLTALVAALMVKRVVNEPVRVSRSLARRMTLFGVKAHTANVSGLANQNLDQLLISAFLAPIRLGLYAVAVTFTSLTALIGSSAAMIALPTLARIGDAAERTRVARRFVTLTAVGSALVTVPLLVFTTDLLSLLFGSGFTPVANVARILLVASVVLSTNRVLTAILNGLGRPLDAGVGETVALVITVLGLATLLPTLGLTGAAVASLLAYTASAGWMARRVREPLGLSSVRELLPGRRDLRSLARASFESTAREVSQ